MARNRKNQAALRFVPALKAVIICALLGASSVGYVLQKNKIFELGRQISEREARLAKFKSEYSLLYAHCAALLNPASLEHQVQKARLHLVRPQPGQIIRLIEPTLNNPTNTTSVQDAPPLLVYGNGFSRPYMK